MREAGMATQKKRITDMTVGKPIELLLRFTLPLLISNVFQQLYSMVDSLVVGNYVGADALAAIGNCSSVNFFLIAICMGLANGVGINVAQYFGAGDEQRVRKVIANAVYVLGGIACFTTVLGVLLAPALLRLLQTPETIIGDSITYMQVSCLGVIWLALYNGVAAILRALGDSKSPLYFLMISSLLNIGLDLFFVIALGWAVFGVALATLIAQMTSAVVSILYAVRKVSYFRLTKGDLRPEKSIIRKIFKIGMPIALQSSMISVSTMVLQGVVNSFGETVMAAYSIGCKMDNLVSGPYVSVCHALTTYAGQNLGARKTDRIREGFLSSVKIIMLFNLVMIPIICLLSGSIVRLFVSDAAVIEVGTTALRITGVCYLALGMIYPSRGVLNGCGDASFSLINGIVEVACRILYSQILTHIPAIGVWGIWLTAGCTWITVAIVCFLRYRSGIWMRKSLVG